MSEQEFNEELIEEFYEDSASFLIPYAAVKSFNPLPNTSSLEKTKEHVYEVMKNHAANFLFMKEFDIYNNEIIFSKFLNRFYEYKREEIDRLVEWYYYFQN